MIWINVFIIICVSIYIVSLSGAIENLLKPMVKKLFKIPKNSVITLGPLDCSLCTSFWTGLIYVICIGEFSLLMLAYICCLSFLSSEIESLLYLLKETLQLVLRNLSSRLYN